MCVVQVIMCRKPEEVLLVTFNHLDGMREYMGGSPVHIDLINNVHRRTREVSLLARGKRPHAGRISLN